MFTLIGTEVENIGRIGINSRNSDSHEDGQYFRQFYDGFRHRLAIIIFSIICGSLNDV